MAVESGAVLVLMPVSAGRSGAPPLVQCWCIQEQAAPQWHRAGRGGSEGQRERAGDQRVEIATVDVERIANGGLVGRADGVRMRDDCSGCVDQGQDWRTGKLSVARAEKVVPEVGLEPTRYR